MSTLYADRPGVATRQFLTDLFIVAWIGGWIWAAVWLRDLIEKLAVPGQKLESAGTGMADNLTEAGSKVDNLPGVGDALAAPFNRAATAATSIADAGRDQQEAVGQVALVLSIGLLVVPLGLVLLGWLPLRVRWIRRAGQASALRAAARAQTNGYRAPGRWRRAAGRDCCPGGL